MTLLVSLGLVLTGQVQAATVIYSSDFSSTSGANSVTGWTYVGEGGGNLSRNATAYDNYDLGGGVFGGDGVKGDGSLLLNTGNNTPQDELWTYTLVSTLSEGMVLNLVGAAFNGNSSHNSTFTIALYNVTDDRVLITSANMGGTRLGLVDENINPFYNFNLSYTTTAADEGDVFQIRVAENLQNTARDIFVDYVTLTSSPAAIPEPSRVLLAGLGLGVVMLRRRRRV